MCTLDPFFTKVGYDKIKVVVRHDDSTPFPRCVAPSSLADLEEECTLLTRYIDDLDNCGEAKDRSWL